jgi:hypothetical protein
LASPLICSPLQLQLAKIRPVTLKKKQRSGLIMENSQPQAKVKLLVKSKYIHGNLKSHFLNKGFDKLFRLKNRLRNVQK